MKSRSSAEDTRFPRTAKDQQADATMLCFPSGPEDVALHPDPDTCELRGVVEFVRDLGSSVEFHVSVDGITLLSVASPRDRPNVSIGQCVGITLHTARAAVTDP